MNSEHTVKRIDSPDGARYVEITVSGEGHYRFVEITRFTEEGYTLWTPTAWSDFYPDAARAEAEARAMLPWLRPASAQAIDLD